ncbi:hypothetical protein LTS18_009244 [Coniosporium uncinatum]|uniref:Uncharacterized protein n=1 Tax=Coniosporium uncinatum TaxID=93489 RepID=A0ACC3DD56_9PEZI|nr:hypothetical protein LTS18_009244 [Coniosporium uncinatum]
MASSLRRRRSIRQDDQAAVLSRLLSVAAAATAASLMGGDQRAVSQARDVGGDGEDGTFDSFLRALQNGSVADALRRSHVDGSDADSSAPLNFFRMFRFGSPSDGASLSSGNSVSGTPGSDLNDDTGGEGRMIPIIIVGIRSINPGSGAEESSIPPFLDALSTFPAPLASPDVTIDGILRQPHNGTRFSHRRRASMSGLRNFPANYDSQRPRPPPSTPATANLSAFSSGNTTPTYNPSSSPGTSSTVPSRRGSFGRRNAAAGLGSTAEEPQRESHQARHRRRMSEGDSSIFGSGSSRRNGVVAPDPSEAPPNEGSRSWIIYVLGGSYPENHPILTTPSLFTDSPTYEDMMLLSALLGPAKPPVASQSDVDEAPGLFDLVVVDGRLVAQAQDGAETIALQPDQRCNSSIAFCRFSTNTRVSGSRLGATLVLSAVVKVLMRSQAKPPKMAPAIRLLKQSSRNHVYA